MEEHFRGIVELQGCLCAPLQCTATSQARPSANSTRRGIMVRKVAVCESMVVVRWICRCAASAGSHAVS